MSRPSIVISVINHKGGTAKTTSAVHLAAAFARKGKKVLAIDLDTQANLTHWLIGELEPNELTIAECILDKSIPLSKIVKPTDTLNLFIAPAGESMVDLELKLHSAMDRERLLKRTLAAAKGEYDIIVLDNPPNIGLTTVNALTASDYYIVPVSCEYLPMVGIKHLLNTIDQIRSLNDKLTNLGYLLTMVDKREGIAADVEDILRKNFKNDVLKHVVRVNTKLKACPQKKKTIFDIEPASGRGYQDYMNVGKEILKRMEALSGTR